MSMLRHLHEQASQEVPVSGHKREPEPPADVDQARDLLEASKLHHMSDRMLAAAQSTPLAVETPVADLIAKIDGD
jgi:hypothetical protein